MIEIRQSMTKFEESCRAGGLKVTHQRMEIYRELTKANDHPSAEILHQRLVKNIPSLSLDTVYRTLSTFEHLGLIKRIETVESHARFEICDEQHHHFICDECGEVTDFYWHTFDAMQVPSTIADLGDIRTKNVVIHGICMKCKNKKLQ